MLRTIIERLSRRVVLKRRLPPRFHNTPLLVTPGAALAYWKLDIEKVDSVLFQIASEQVRRGDVVWDIGANVGLFSFAAVALAGPEGRVLAVEPDTDLARLLRRSCRLKENVKLNVDVLAAAVSDMPGIARLNIAERGRAANYLDGVWASTQTGGVREVQLVPTVTLDSLLDHFSAPRFVKIDVEGAEHLVLRGAKRLLAEVRPIILCEVTAQRSIEVARLLAGHGYTLYDARMPSGRRVPLEEPTWDTLAYPSTTG